MDEIHARDQPHLDLYVSDRAGGDACQTYLFPAPLAVLSQEINNDPGRIL